MTERGITRFFKNLQAGGKLVFFRSAGRFEFRFSLNQIVILIAALFAVSILADYLTTDAPKSFNIYGVSSLTFHMAALFVGAYVVTAIQRTPTMFTGFAVILLSTGLIFNLIIRLETELITVLPDDWDTNAGPWIYWIVFGWAVFVIFRAVRARFTPGIARSLILTIIYTLVWVAPQYLVAPPEFWYTESKRSPQKAAASRPRPNVERTYYAQPRLLRRHLEAIADNRPNVTDLYFLGFAGYAHQDVFMREVTSVTALFDKRFDTKGRSLGLINNMRTLRTHPLANVHNLKTALHGMAAKMDVEQDILFLFLTSHGSQNATVSTRFWPMQHNILSAGRLSHALDTSGITWRVIVVSACYSGSFIEALRNDHTLVITASRPDRNSFGCSNEADYTYFGRAYFDEALRAGTSFIEAFETARRAVDERERAQDFKPSEPQMVIGRHIKAKLHELEQRLENSEVSAMK